MKKSTQSFLVTLGLGMFLAPVAMAQQTIGGSTSPGSTLDVRGSVGANYQQVTASSYGMTATDYYVVYNGTAAGTITLPAAGSGSSPLAASFRGRLYTIKNTTAAQTLTVTPAGSETIDGSTTLAVPAGQSVQLVSTGATSGATWEIVAFAAATSGGAGAGVRANNGLSLSTPGNVQLGGPLVRTTDVATAGFHTTLSGTGRLGLGVPAGTAPGERLEVNGNLRLGSEPATATTGYGNFLEFDGSGVNTDPIGLVRYNSTVSSNANNQSELRLVLGDDPAAPGSTTNSADRFVLGTTNTSGVGTIASGTFTPQFYVYSNGAVGIGGDASASYLLNVTGASHTTTNHIVDGNVGIGTNSPSSRLDVNGTARTVGRASFNDGVAISSTGQPTMTITSTSAAINGAPANTAGNFYYEAPGLETHVFGGDVVPDADGTRRLGYSTARWSAVYAANGIIQTSDARLKKNVRNLGLGLAAVLKLRPVLYDWKDNSGANKLGFIAQELRQVVPNVVIGDEQKENLGVLYADLVPVLTKAIQEQQAQIEALKAANAKLQAQATGAMKAQAELQDVKASLQSLTEQVRQLQAGGTTASTK